MVKGGLEVFDKDLSETIKNKPRPLLYPSDGYLKTKHQKRSRAKLSTNKRFSGKVIQDLVSLKNYKNLKLIREE
jgi:hypothetical protein